MSEDFFLKIACWFFASSIIFLLGGSYFISLASREHVFLSFERMMDYSKYCFYSCAFSLLAGLSSILPTEGGLELVILVASGITGLVVLDYWTEIGIFFPGLPSYETSQEHEIRIPCTPLISLNEWVNLPSYEGLFPDLAHSDHGLNAENRLEMPPAYHTLRKRMLRRDG